jgi:uncharacterized cupin superfamily protein
MIGKTMDTRLSHLTDIPTVTGVPLDWAKAELFAGKQEQRLAKAVGLTQFGVNSVKLNPGAWSALRHWHEAEDEFVLLLDGVLTLIDNNGEHLLTPGTVVGFPAGEANGHHLINRSDEAASYLVVGSRKPSTETIHYPDEDFGPVRK